MFSGLMALVHYVAATGGPCFPAIAVAQPDGAAPILYVLGLDAGPVTTVHGSANRHPQAYCRPGETYAAVWHTQEEHDAPAPYQEPLAAPAAPVPFGAAPQAAPAEVDSVALLREALASLPPEELAAVLAGHAPAAYTPPAYAVPPSSPGTVVPFGAPPA